MSMALFVVLPVVFALLQLLFSKNFSNKVIGNIPVIISAVIAAFAIVLHILSLITYNCGIISRSVLVENQYFAAMLLIPAGICLVGSIVGVLIGKIK